MIKTAKLTVLLILIFQTSSWAQMEDIVNKLDQYIESSRILYEVPGMSVTIVQDGQTLLAKGYGVKSVSTNEKVDTNTLFVMASTTKAMTAAAMAMLVDEGKVKWTDLVIDHLPTFRLSDPYVTNEITVKDLFTHNTGLGGTDLLWTMWDYAPEQMINRLQDAQLSYSLRDGYRYQNVMYMTAGLIIEKASGKSWETFIKERIFDPLGMNRSCALRSQAYQDMNRVKPHSKVDGTILEIIDSSADSISAAGSGWTCSSDIANWIQFMADGGIWKGEQLISKKGYSMITSPQILIQEPQFYSSQVFTKPHFRAYGLGWYMHDYAGEKVLFHTGSLNGAVAIAGLIPDKRIGIYITGNLGGAEVRHALMYKIFDSLLDLGDRDWSPDIKSLYENIRRERSERKVVREQSRLLNTSPTHALSHFTGAYSNDFLGQLTVGLYETGLRITTRVDRHLLLSHWQHNTFKGVVEEYQNFEDGSLIDFDISANNQPILNLYGYEFKKTN